MTGHFTVGSLRDLTARAIISSSRELVSRRALFLAAAVALCTPKRIMSARSLEYRAGRLLVSTSSFAGDTTYKYTCPVCVRIDREGLDPPMAARLFGTTYRATARPVQTVEHFLVFVRKGLGG